MNAHYQKKCLMIVDLFHKLKTAQLVSSESGIPIKTVYYALHNSGIKTPRGGIRGKSVCDKNSKLVLEMCESGKSLTQMARTVGTNVARVKEFLVRKGIDKKFSVAKYGEDHYAWKGRLIDKDGYILIHVKNHPCNRKHTNYIFEHRLVMENHIGRYLLPQEVVHHIDGNKQNNSIENLQLFANNADHLRHELKGRCPNWSEEGKARMREGAHRRKQRRLASIHQASEACVQPCIEMIARSET